MSVFDRLEPAVVWRNFEAITKVPRPSGQEEKLAAYLAGWAEERGFTSDKDEVGNLVIRVPATPGKEAVPTVVLQGHLDMVCEKNNDVEFDFFNDPIKVIRDGDFLTADGTTLGADNGIGLAMGMAVADDPDAAHPPLELLFTVEEETGLTGVFGLGPDFITGKRLINIDSEEEGSVFVGCAGSADVETFWPLECGRLEPDREFLRIGVDGLIGGHSGLVIHENRGNALKLLGLFLSSLAEREPLSLCRFEGGDKHNALPRNAESVVAGAPGLSKRAHELKSELTPRLLTEFGNTDPELHFNINPTEKSIGLSVQDSRRLLHLLCALPHGLDTMSKEVEGLVETSCNLAIAKWSSETAEISLWNSIRSSVDYAIRRMQQQIASIPSLAGARYLLHEGYPAWQPNMASELLAFARNVYEQTTGKTAAVTGIHAGLECGIIGEKYPGMDMISIGPDMFDVHSPDERLSISSTARFYPFLKALLNAVE